MCLRLQPWDRDVDVVGGLRLPDIGLGVLELALSVRMDEGVCERSKAVADAFARMLERSLSGNVEGLIRLGDVVTRRI